MSARQHIFVALAILVGIAELWALCKARWRDGVSAARALRA
jgi:hypothetical protein